jgi:hypothetical protein
MKYYSLYVCDTQALMDASIEAMTALSFNFQQEVSACPLNIELLALLAEGKSEEEIYTAICAHHDEGHYDLYWSAAIFSPVTQLSNEAHQANIVRQMKAEYPDQVGLLVSLNLHPEAKAVFEGVAP